jgi:hypothetical protein
VKAALLAVLVGVLASACLAACGGSSKSTGSLSAASNASASADQAQLRYKGDEDDEEEPGENSEEGANKGDKDADFDNDAKDRERGYHDSDDGEIVNFGKAAGEPEAAQLTSLVKRYYAAAAAENGAQACAIMRKLTVQSVPEDYGSGAGPKYLRGKTCPVVMVKLFKHQHAQLSAPYAITGMRVQGNQADVLLGSTMNPASYFRLEREGGAWKSVGMVASLLP